VTLFTLFCKRLEKVYNNWHRSKKFKRKKIKSKMLHQPFIIGTANQSLTTSFDNRRLRSLKTPPPLHLPFFPRDRRRCAHVRSHLSLRVPLQCHRAASVWGFDGLRHLPPPRPDSDETESKNTRSVARPATHRSLASLSLCLSLARLYHILGGIASPCVRTPWVVDWTGGSFVVKTEYPLLILFIEFINQHNTTPKYKMK